MQIRVWKIKKYNFQADCQILLVGKWKVNWIIITSADIPHYASVVQVDYFISNGKQVFFSTCGLSDFNYKTG